MIKRVMFFNQVTGPLFLETAESIADMYPEKSTLLTGNADTLNKSISSKKLRIISAPSYRISNKFFRILTWCRYSFLALYQLLKTDKSTLIFFVSNPPILAPILYILLKFLNRKYVVLVYDIYPDILISLNQLKPNSLISRIWRKINKKVYEDSECVLTLGSHMASLLQNQFDFKKTAIDEVGVVPIWANNDRVKPIPKPLNKFAVQNNQVGFFTVLYSGNIGASHDIETILGAADILLSHNDIKFIFIGNGHKKAIIDRYIADKKKSNVTLLPLQSDNIFPLSISVGDVSLVALDYGAEKLMIPSKVSYYMAAGSAIIGICDKNNDLYDILNKSGGGFVIPSGCPQDLANAILNLKNDKIKLDTYRSNARNASETIFSKEMSLKKLQSYLEIACLLPKD